MRKIYFMLALALPLAPFAGISSQTLRGSAASIAWQNSVAQKQDYTFLRTARDVRRFVDLGLLVPLRGDAHYELAAVSNPYARPAVRTFVQRLSSQYMSACGEKLVVTSLTRPLARQPYNASDLSVHPAGMAVDLRVSRKVACRRWLERTLLALERSDVLDATREHTPAHYHVALFPSTYVAYVKRLEQRHAVQVASTAETTADASPTGPSPDQPATDESEVTDYRVNRGDTLWSIARKYETSIEQLKELNGLTSSRITAGQVLVVPAGN